MMDQRAFEGAGGPAAFLASIVESAGDAIVAIDPQGTIVTWNPAAQRLYGYEPDEIIGCSISQLIPPERKDELERILTAVAGGEGVERLETTHLTKESRAVDVSLIASPIRATDGSIVGASTIVHDITDRSRFAVESQRAERLEVASRLARGIARELVDLVTAIQGHASLVLEDLADDPRSGRSADAVRRATQRAAEVAHQLLALSGDQIMSPQALDLNQRIAGSIRLLGEVAGRSTTIELELDPSIPDIEVDPDQFDHVLVGLVAASRERLRTGGKITLATRQGKATSGPSDVVLTVHDDGEPIPAPELESIFEPFHTSKRTTDGNLWLATAHGILTQSGGSIRATSGPSGTTFTVRLPAAGAIRVTEAPLTVDPLPRGSEWILVVDDEDGVREFMERALSRLGYHITAVSSGEEALERVLGYFAEPIDLLITDVVLPGISGPELALALGSSRPQMPVLYVSGYASDVTAFHGLPGLAAHVLAKPFGMDGLVRRVRTILDERPAPARPEPLGDESRAESQAASPAEPQPGG